MYNVEFYLFLISELDLVTFWTFLFVVRCLNVAPIGKFSLKFEVVAVVEVAANVTRFIFGWDIAFL